MRVSPPIFTRIFVALAVAVAVPDAGAQEQPAEQIVELGPETNLPLPRFVSLRGGKVNVRRGPGLEYRIDWVFQRSGLPVRVIDEYGNWRRIADSDDAGGWVYHALLTGRCCNAWRTGVWSNPGAARAGCPRAPSGAWMRTRSSEGEAVSATGCTRKVLTREHHVK
jgi:SH3-like domain-containing protein